ncbi:hypothetical protein [Streptomyces sp. NPDC002156]
MTASLYRPLATYATKARVADTAISVLSGQAVERFLRSVSSTTAAASQTPAKIP